MVTSDSKKRLHLAEKVRIRQKKKKKGEDAEDLDDETGKYPCHKLVLKEDES